MSPIDRQQPIWYYRLGNQTLGPVAWTEIEQLIKDTIDADDLLVARGGDPSWTTAAKALEQFPELAPEAEETPAGAPEEEPEDVEWILEGEEEREPFRAEQPVFPAAPDRTAVTAAKGRTPEPGLGKWIGHAWEMVIGEIWPWVGAMLLMIFVTAVTLGIAGPPLLAGMYMMALKRWNEETLGASDVFAGFSRFWSAWGLALLMGLAVMGALIPFLVLTTLATVMSQSSGEDAAPFIVMALYALYPVMYLAVLGIQTAFFYSWVLVAEGEGTWEAVTRSWQKVREQFWSYLGIYLVLSILSSIGAYLCYVGIFVTWPLLPCATVAAYRWHFRT